MRVSKTKDGGWMFRAALSGEQVIIARILKEVSPGKVLMYTGQRKRGSFSIVSFEFGKKNGCGCVPKQNVLALAGTTEEDKNEVNAIGDVCSSGLKGLLFLEAKKLEKGKMAIVVRGS